MTMFAAGSFARHEASEYSDIDMFFIYDGMREDLDEPRTNELRLFGSLIEAIDTLSFPKFSNDCQFLEVLSAPKIAAELGGPEDDHSNNFTTRMLLLLESKPLFGNDTYDRVVSQLIEAYYRDYRDHQASFEPIFLVNDIARFWKTLLLNYERKRNPEAPLEGAQKTKQKVRNFKLKYSRMTTCFATIAALGSYGAPVHREQVVELVKLTPRERLELVAANLPSTEATIAEVLTEYAWFLEQTALPQEQLYIQFEDKTRLRDLFDRANRYGDFVYSVLAEIDRSSPTGPGRFLRYLVI